MFSFITFQAFLQRLEISLTVGNCACLSHQLLFSFCPAGVNKKAKSCEFVYVAKSSRVQE